MAKRAFKLYTIAAGGTPQPLIGTKTSAATGPSGQDPNGDPSVVKVPVSDSSMFQNGDWAIIGSTANSDEERVLVQSVPDSTHIVVKGMALTHVTASYVRLSIFCQSVYVQTKQGNAGAIYVGLQGIVKATYANVLATLYFFASPTQPIDYTDPVRVGEDGADIGQYFCDGTTGDGYVPSLTIL